MCVQGVASIPVGVCVCRCDSCSVCRGVCMWVCRVVQIFLQGCACVPACGCVGLVQIHSTTDKLYCYCTAIVGC